MTVSPDLHGQLTALTTSLTSTASASSPEDQGLEASAAAVAGVDGPNGTLLAAAGTTAMFAGDGSPLPPDSSEIGGVDTDTLFDMASVTKVVTALTAATLIDDGTLDPEAPVAEHLSSPHPVLTARHLLTHTSGLPPVLPLWRQKGGREDRLRAVHGATLETEPGTAHAYSCIGFILLGRLMEALTSMPLPVLARERVLLPADAGSAVWADVPMGPAPLAAQVAATEHQSDPDRGLVRGSTHDETAWSLGGVGNAGLFATIRDTLAIGRVLAGRAGSPTLSQSTQELLRTDQLPAEVTTGAPWRQGFGVRIGQETSPGTLLPGVVGHPGFTGTSVVADPHSGVVAALLTNRVHPVRTRFTVEASRRALASFALG